MTQNCNSAITARDALTEILRTGVQSMFKAGIEQVADYINERIESVDRMAAGWSSGTGYSRNVKSRHRRRAIGCEAAQSARRSAAKRARDAYGWEP